MSYAYVIDVLAKCGASSDALKAEHELISLLMRMLNDAISSGAEQGIIVRLLDLVDEECRSHFADEEKYLAERGAANLLETHAAVHGQLLELTLRARSAVMRCDPTGILDTQDLLYELQYHISNFDQSAYTLEGRTTMSGADFVGSTDDAQRSSVSRESPARAEEEYADGHAQSKTVPGNGGGSLDCQDLN